MDPHRQPAVKQEDRILLFVATRRDAEVTQKMLASAGLPSTACESVHWLVEEISRGAAAVLATDELLESADVRRLFQVLAEQEEWSDLPFVLLMRGGVHSVQATDVLQRISNVTILERPAGMRTVLSAVQAATRARRRQYETRAHIQAIRDAEAKARQAAGAKDDFLAALSHELRTPLTPVLLLASEAATDPVHSPEVREMFDLIAKNVALEARLIDDLLDLTRVTRGKLRLDKRPLDILSVLRDAVANVRPDFVEKSIALVTSFAVDHVRVDGDPTRIQQVFWNVLRNAAKFTPPGGRVTANVTQSADHSRVVVEVKDTGIGMEPDELAAAFEAFVQGKHANSVSAHQFGGLGLGLAISRSLVEMQGGTISASSPGRNRGSTFRIEFPLTLAPPPPETTPYPADIVVPAELDILVVEDHAPSREAIRRLLALRGHRVRAAASIVEARLLAHSKLFDLLITDIGLPDGTGYDLLAELRPLGNFLAVAITGYGMDDDVRRGKEAGFFTHITKPLRAADLDLVMKSVVEKLRPKSDAGSQT